MATDTILKSLVINKLTKAQYDMIKDKNPNELYIITDYYDNDNKAVIYTVNGMTKEQTNILPLGITLTDVKQIVSVNIANTVILPTLYRLSQDNSSIVLSNPVLANLKWSVQYLLDVNVLPPVGVARSSTTSNGVTSYATRDEATAQVVMDKAVTPNALSDYVTTNKLTTEVNNSTNSCPSNKAVNDALLKKVGYPSSMYEDLSSLNYTATKSGYYYFNARYNNTGGLLNISIKVGNVSSSNKSIIISDVRQGDTSIYSISPIIMNKNDNVEVLATSASGSVLTPEIITARFIYAEGEV